MRWCLFLHPFSSSPVHPLFLLFCSMSFCFRFVGSSDRRFISGDDDEDDDGDDILNLCDKSPALSTVVTSSGEDGIKTETGNADAPSTGNALELLRISVAKRRRRSLVGCQVFLRKSKDQVIEISVSSNVVNAGDDVTSRINDVSPSADLGRLVVYHRFSPRKANMKSPWRSAVRSLKRHEYFLYSSEDYNNNDIREMKIEFDLPFKQEFRFTLYVHRRPVVKAPLPIILSDAALLDDVCALGRPTKNAAAADYNDNDDPRFRTRPRLRHKMFPLHADDVAGRFACFFWYQVFGERFVFRLRMVVEVVAVEGGLSCGAAASAASSKFFCFARTTRIGFSNFSASPFVRSLEWRVTSSSSSSSLSSAPSLSSSSSSSSSSSLSSAPSLSSSSLSSSSSSVVVVGGDVYFGSTLKIPRSEKTRIVECGVGKRVFVKGPPIPNCQWRSPSSSSSFALVGSIEASDFVDVVAIVSVGVVILATTFVLGLNLHRPGVFNFLVRLLSSSSSPSTSLAFSSIDSSLIRSSSLSSSSFPKETLRSKDKRYSLNERVFHEVFGEKLN